MGESLIVNKKEIIDLSFITATSSDILSGKISCDTDMNPVIGTLNIKEVKSYTTNLEDLGGYSFGLYDPPKDLENISQVKSVSVVVGNSINHSHTNLRLYGLCFNYIDNMGYVLGMVVGATTRKSVVTKITSLDLSLNDRYLKIAKSSIGDLAVSKDVVYKCMITYESF